MIQHDIVINKIFLYLWKFRITDLNSEYKNKYNDETDYSQTTNIDDRDYNILGSYNNQSHNQSKWCINYRRYTNYYYNNQTNTYEVPFMLSHLLYQKHMYMVTPKYYWYSSGFMNPNGYNNNYYYESDSESDN